VRVPVTVTAVLRRVRHPRTTVRGRLALLYGSVFLASGIALLAITYILVDDAIRRFAGVPAPPGRIPGSLPVHHMKAVGVRVPPAQSRLLLQAQRTVDLHSLLLGSSIALGVMTVASMLLGWLVAGRILRPLRAITNTARHISEDNLGQRLALQGARDELNDLGEVIDGLLDRLQAAFEAQRHFVANAAHELRAPLTLDRATLQVTLADPGLTLGGLRAACEQVIDNGRQQEQLIEALLTLARSQRGLDATQPLDLAVIAADQARARTHTAAAAGVQLHLALGPAPACGDPQLLQRLVANLLANALRYNHPGGTVHITTGDHADGSRLIVTNTGPVVPENQIARLLEPFQRIAPSRTGQHDGLGLGLSIVQAITKAHRAQLLVNAGQGGGLTAEIRFPARPSPHNGYPVSVTTQPRYSRINLG
jgi:signal transduction histidine kinase